MYKPENSSGDKGPNLKEVADLLMDAAAAIYRVNYDSGAMQAVNFHVNEALKELRAFTERKEKDCLTAFSGRDGMVKDV
ncbi:MAG: hypothetical protein Q4A74_00185 [Cardiobacteriaceae bacterium]|nr:hypothetical protein [Cardiobacteriaceae bacterium]